MGCGSDGCTLYSTTSNRDVKGKSGGKCEARFVRYLAGLRVVYEHARATNAILLSKIPYLPSVNSLVLRFQCAQELSSNH